MNRHIKCGGNTLKYTLTHLLFIVLWDIKNKGREMAKESLFISFSKKRDIMREGKKICNIFFLISHHYKLETWWWMWWKRESVFYFTTNSKETYLSTRVPLRIFQHPYNFSSLVTILARKEGRSWMKTKLSTIKNIIIDLNIFLKIVVDNDDDPIKLSIKDMWNEGKRKQWK